MSVIRVVHNKENPYVQLNKEALWDERISLKAIGLWARCLSRPDNWRFNIKELASKIKEGRRAIDGAINELIEHNYAVRLEHWEKSEDGKFKTGGVEYVFFEFAATEEDKQKVLEEFKKSFRHCCFGNRRNGYSRNSNLLNNKSSSNEEDISIHKERESPPPLFESFYEGQFENKVKITKEQRQRLVDKFGGNEALIDQYAEKLYRWSFNNPKKYKEKTRHDMVIEDWIEKDHAKQPDKPKQDSSLSDAQQKNWNLNLELVNELKIDCPNKADGLHFYYKHHVLKDKNNPHLDISALIDHKEFCRYLEKHLDIDILSVRFPNG